MTANVLRICKDKRSFACPSSSLYRLWDCRPWRIKQAGSWSLRFSCSLRQATRVGAVVGDAGKTQGRRAARSPFFEEMVKEGVPIRFPTCSPSSQ